MSLIGLGVRGGGHRAGLSPRLQGGGGRVCGGDSLRAPGHPSGREPAARHGHLAVRVELMEIRSYRRVFDLERRIYRVDRLRLNPGGIPVRGVVYFLVILAATLIAGRLPLLATVARVLPWYLRDLALPAVSAAILTMIRVEGRPFHLAAGALVRYRIGPRRLAGVRRLRRSWRALVPRGDRAVAGRLGQQDATYALHRTRRGARRGRARASRPAIARRWPGMGLSATPSGAHAAGASGQTGSEPQTGDRDCSGCATAGAFRCTLERGER